MSLADYERNQRMDCVHVWQKPEREVKSRRQESKGEEAV
jgi:hypothetical protein